MLQEFVEHNKRVDELRRKEWNEYTEPKNEWSRYIEKLENNKYKNGGY